MQDWIIGSCRSSLNFHILEFRLNYREVFLCIFWRLWQAFFLKCLLFIEKTTSHGSGIHFFQFKNKIMAFMIFIYYNLVLSSIFIWTFSYISFCVWLCVCVFFFSFVKNVDGVNYIHVKVAGLLFVATTRVNVSPSLVIELLQRIARVIKDYLGVLNEDSLRKNFVLVYELLDEAIVSIFCLLCSLLYKFFNFFMKPTGHLWKNSCLDDTSICDDSISGTL